MTTELPATNGTNDTNGSSPAVDPTRSKLAIIGSGPAGLTAALYAARANLAPMVFAGNAPLGQLMITSDVENYPGFPDGILGPELMDLFRRQAERFGARLLDEDVTKVDFSERPFKLWVREDLYLADAVIVATGASALWLGLESEEAFRGRGVSACATCDGFFFRDRDVAVVGGGDTALEEALLLTKFANKVTMLVRRDEFRGSKIMQDRAFAHPKIAVKWNREVAEVLGDSTVSQLRLRDTGDGSEELLDAQGLFIAIGYKPNTDLFAGQLDLDALGYCELSGRGPGETSSNIEGVFVAGDVHDHRYRQAVTAAGDGCKAAIDAERWLESIGEHVATTATNW
jgi:thioredoxin reductase (NADPH)